jgi:hypothetical protein
VISDINCEKEIAYGSRSMLPTKQSINTTKIHSIVL